MSITAHWRTGANADTKARLQILAPPLAALLYPFALQGFNFFSENEMLRSADAFDSSDSVRTARPLRHAHSIDLPGPTQLERGETLAQVRVVYETYGTLNPAADNAVFVELLRAVVRYPNEAKQKYAAMYERMATLAQSREGKRI